MHEQPFLLLHEQESDSLWQSSHGSPPLPVEHAVSVSPVTHWLFALQHPFGQLLESQEPPEPLLLPLPPLLAPASRDARHAPNPHRPPLAVQS